MKRRTRQQKMESKRVQRRAGMKNPGGNSRYARKVKYLLSHDIHGSDVPFPKPWNTAA